MRSERPLTEAEQFNLSRQMRTMQRRGRPATHFKWRKYMYLNSTENWVQGKGLPKVSDVEVKDKVVLVGACPSLDHQLEKLRDLIASGYQVIVMDRAVECLQHYNITPDIITCIESSEKVHRFLDFPCAEKAALICGLRTWPGLVRKHKGPVHFYISRTYEHEEFYFGVTQKLDMPYLEEFDHVGGLSYCFAKTYGAQEVEMVGNDYYFEGYEKYSSIMQDDGFWTTQYYAKPIKHKLAPMFKKTAGTTMIIVRDEPWVFDKYPIPLDPKQKKGKPGKYMEGMFRFLRARLKDAVNEYSNNDRQPKSN